MATVFKKERAFFEKKLPEFLKNHRDQVVAIEGENVLGFFTDMDKALNTIVHEQHKKPGTFIVQKIIPLDEELSTITRVRF
ncbi:hypothetical protein [Leptospira koniambonensis]|uniref:hypothetical protein n=1 Tax=Leptospira koniambonensis TaxID=2484950 RepID=UPI003EB86C8C